MPQITSTKTLLVFLISLFIHLQGVFSQEETVKHLKGIVLSDNDEILPYASIRLNGSTKGTITNEDGIFIIDRKYATDNKITVSYIGYKTKVLEISENDQEIIIRLEKLYYSLNEVTIIGTKGKSAYDITKKLIRKYRSNTKTRKSKAFFCLYSKKEKPLEIFEAFYNATISQCATVKNLDLKNGRAGLVKNRNYAFFSLNTTDIICDFSPFMKTHDMKLPITPTNLSLIFLKSGFEMKVEHIIDEGDARIAVIAFKPKLKNGHYFSGKMYVDMDQNIMRKYVLQIINTQRTFLQSINEGVTIDSLDIYLELNYSPENAFVESIVYEYSFQLSNQPAERIETKSLFAFYDFENPFDMPVSEPFNLDFDYQRILSYPYMDVFWRNNYYIPQSQNRIDFTNYFAEYGILVNHDSLTAKSSFIESPCYAWEKDKRLTWNDFNLEKPAKPLNLGTPYVIISSSGSESMFIDGHIFLDYTSDKGSKQYFSQTTFNRLNSYALNYTRNTNTLIYLNLYFDLYEVYRNKLMYQLNSKPMLSREEIEILYQNNITQLNQVLKRLKYETKGGKKYSGLLKWNDYILDNLGVENINLRISP